MTPSVECQDPDAVKTMQCIPRGSVSRSFPEHNTALPLPDTHVNADLLD